MKNVVFWDIMKPVRTLQKTHYLSATESSRLMICRVWGFHGGDYEWDVISCDSSERTSAASCN
jgi:hypothetical protein